MMVTGRADVDSREVDAALQRVDNAANHNAKAMNQVALLLDQFVRNTFRTQTSPWGLPWPEWADREALLAARRRKGIFTTSKLIATGEMFDSIEHTSDDTSAEVTEGEGLPDPRAAVHQFGNMHIPPRPSFPMRSPNEVAFPDNWLQAVFVPIVAAMQESVR